MEKQEEDRDEGEANELLREELYSSPDGTGGAEGEIGLQLCTVWSSQH